MNEPKDAAQTEQMHAMLGTAGPDLHALAQQWADNKVHTYQFVAQAEKIVAGRIDAALAEPREAVRLTAEQAHETMVTLFGRKLPFTGALMARVVGAIERRLWAANGLKEPS
ncbi:hypothetical protein UFOVP703_73 [uncultured Caudovirales phage]|uniref:Uncharacterized protein n=1 Tax=uncultured Caudovirales phage TaxID=2100421 RepID=A0A6J5NND5_9CAUD|nr:hypothetical protein UFOVP703_73 [uncultured Caudovirales phage]